MKKRISSAKAGPARPAAKARMQRLGPSRVARRFILASRGWLVLLGLGTPRPPWGSGRTSHPALAQQQVQRQADRAAQIAVALVGADDDPGAAFVEVVAM